MKNLCRWLLAIPVAAILPVTSLPLHAQLAASGTPGDRAVYTIGSGATLATGFGTSVTHDFATTTVDDTADSFELQAGGAVSLTAGHHIVIYGTRYLNGAGGARAGLDNTLLLNGSAIAYGASSTYSRDGTNNNHFVRGGAIVEVAQGDSIALQSLRTDNHPQTLNQQDADLQLVKLDDSLSFLRLGASANVANLMSNSSAGPVPVSYDVQDEVDAGFTHTSGSGQVTLNDAGSYLVFANTGFRISGGNRHRQSITQRLTLDGTPVEDSNTVVYIRYSSATDGVGGLMETGATSLGTIIKTSAANSVLQVEALRDNTAANTNTSVALEASLTGLTILKLPGYGEYLSLSGPAQNINFPQGNPETALDLSDISPVSNASFSFDATTSSSQVTVNKAGDYLFLSSHFVNNFDTAGNNQRTITRQGFQTTPSGGSAGKISYGNGGAYNRDDTAGGDRARDSGDWAGAILPLGAGDLVETTTARFGGPAALTASTVGLRALNIGSISSAPTAPVVEINLPLNTVVNSTGNIITDESHLKTIHISDPATDLTYTLDSAPAGGSLELSGVALAAGETFTQDDINNDRLAFAAGGTATEGGFDFTVRDTSSNAVSGSFVVNVGAATALTNDAAATNEDTGATEADLTSGANLLANDSGSSLSITSHDSSSTNGASVTVTATGTFSYDPTGSAALQALDTGDQLDDTFTYTVTDIFNQQTTATVTVTVDGVNDAPVAGDDAYTNGERSVSSGNLLANDTDADGSDTLAVTNVGGSAPGTIVTPKGATLTVNADGSFSYDPSTSATLSALASGTSDVETISYEVSDGTATVSASIIFTTLGEAGGSPDHGTVDATGASSTASLAILANDNIGGAAGTPTAGAPFDLNASDATAANTDGVWNNSNTVSGKFVTMENAGTGSVLLTPLDNSPPGITHAYDLSGTGSGGTLGDTDTPAAANFLYGTNFSRSSFSVEALIRPDDHVGPEPIWGSGGNGTGSSLILVDDQLIYTIGNSAQVAQAIAIIPQNAIAGGDYVHVLGTFDIAADVISLYINGVLADTGNALNITNGAAGNVTDWSGS
ncbi:MAG: Ig-like domain-containing protein, partial [Roseibacillus sp.]|nr:Ig-like domain-containing protein [Roseibacillus sp.]